MSKVSKIMGLDFGSKTLGVSISDELLLCAHPLATIKRDRESKLRSTISALKIIIEENNIGLIVLGLPLNNDGSLNKRAEKTLIFKELLTEKFNIDILMVDESLTTISSDEILFRCNIAVSERKKYIDSLAASVILQEYLDNKDFYKNKIEVICSI